MRGPSRRTSPTSMIASVIAKPALSVDSSDVTEGSCKRPLPRNIATLLTPNATSTVLWARRTLQNGTSSHDAPISATFWMAAIFSDG